MTTEKMNAVYKIKSLMEGDTLSLILGEIKNDLASAILRTSPSDSEKREELYNLANCLTLVQTKLQEFVNYDEDSLKGD